MKISRLEPASTARRRITGWGLPLLFLAGSLAVHAAAGGSTETQFAFFGLTNIWRAELRLTPEQWGVLIKGKQLLRLPQPDETDLDYVYSHASLTLGDRVYPDVGIRIKGGG